MRNKIAKAIEALQGTTATEETPSPGRKATPPSVEQVSPLPEPAGPTAQAKRKLSAAGRRAIIAATKKRWAAIRAAKAAAMASVAAAPKATPAKAPVPVKKGALTEAGRKALSIAMKKRWAAKKKAAEESTPLRNAPAERLERERKAKGD